MYLAARSWGIQPSEFWEMTLGEWMLEAFQHHEEAKNAPKQHGVLSKEEVLRLKEDLFKD